jgi:glucose-1-phosphate thymidylyltransferase
MDAIVLAAGFATRMAPLTDDCPKPLLPVRGVPILDFVLAKVFAVPQVRRIVLVSNHKFIGHFENWLRWRRPPLPIQLLDDGATSNDTRLGAIGDLKLAIKQAGVVGDALVVAADNLFAASLAEMVAFANERSSDCVIVRHLEDLKARQRTGIAVLDVENRVVEFQEKPHAPKTHWAVPPIYVYRRATLAMLDAYLEQGNHHDSPGNFLKWLCAHRRVVAWQCDAEIFDIGNREDYTRAQVEFDAAKQAAFGITPWR